MTARELIQKFQHAAEMRRQERAAFAEYGGYSWGYVGAGMIEAAESAEKELEDALGAFVDERVAAALKNAGK
jgi:hypothetical protein